MKVKQVRSFQGVIRLLRQGKTEFALRAGCLQSSKDFGLVPGKKLRIEVCHNIDGTFVTYNEKEFVERFGTAMKAGTLVVNL